MNWIFWIGVYYIHILYTVYILRLFFPSIVCHRKSSCIIVHVTSHRDIDAEFARNFFEAIFSSAKRVRLPSVTTQRIFHLKIKLKNLFKIKKLRIFGFYARHNLNVLCVLKLWFGKSVLKLKFFIYPSPDKN